jgi:t-SNARE complex subunit (syntaxin)
MANVPIQTYRKENIEKFFEDIKEDYGYATTNEAKFEAAKALIWRKERKKIAKYYIIMLIALGFLIGYFLFNINIVYFFNFLTNV